jgi:hypothetical protein
LKTRQQPGRRFRRTLLRAGVFALAVAGLAAQSITVNVMNDTLHVRAPGFGVIKGDTLNRLKNGATVRFEFELSVLPGPAAAPALQSRQSFILSYDLWEERFAVTRTGIPTRSISHRTPSDAEAWCVEQLALPVTSLGRLGRDVPFWLRLEYNVLDGTPARPDDAGFTLRGMIDALSGRRRVDEPRQSVVAGPFRLPN